MNIKPTDPDYSATLHACDKCGSLYVGNHGRYRCESMRWSQGHSAAQRCDGLIKPASLSAGRTPTLAVVQEMAAQILPGRIEVREPESSVIGRNIAGEVLHELPGEPQNLPTGQPSPITQPIYKPDPRVP